MKPALVLLALIALVLAGLYHFAPLQTLNLFLPKDQGSRLRVADVSYGPLPRQKLDIYAPAQGQGPWPTAVFVHGGSWMSGNKNPYEFAGRALAAQGFLVLAINYRLHPENHYPAFVEDTARAIDWATREAGRYGGRQDAIFAMGHSAGAYNAALAVLDRHYLSDLGTNLRAIRGVIGLAGPYDFVPLDVDVTKEVFGYVADLAATQPVNFARADAPPFLLIHGADDTTALPRNSRALDASLKAAGGRSTLIIHEGLGHVGVLLALAKPFRSWAPVLEEAAAFVRDNAK